MRTAEQTSLLVALLYKRSNQRHARLDVGTIRCLSGRRHIRSAFVRMLARCLDDLGLVLIEIDGGGFSLVASSALADAPAVTVEEYLADDLNQLQQGEIDFGDIRAELGRKSGMDDSNAPKTWLRLDDKSPNSLARAERPA